MKRKVEKTKTGYDVAGVLFSPKSGWFKPDELIFLCQEGEDIVKRRFRLDDVDMHVGPTPRLEIHEETVSYEGRMSFLEEVDAHLIFTENYPKTTVTSIDLYMPDPSQIRPETATLNRT